MESLKFSLKEFEGSLDLLLALIQKQELDLLTIPITDLTGQLGKSEAPINSCADSMALTATLLLLKSRKLLPAHEQDDTVNEEEQQRLDLIEHLLTFCRLKEAAKDLIQKEEQQQIHFLREPLVSKNQKGTGLADISLQTLEERLTLVMERSAALHNNVEDEEWHVDTALNLVRNRLAAGELSFEQLLHEEMCRGELIVTFLALLELMKHGEISVVQKDEQWFVNATS